MKSGILNAVEAKKTFAVRIRIVATAILTMLCVVLPLFALPAAETEAAKYSLPKNREVDAPSRKDICGVYSIKLSNNTISEVLSFSELLVSISLTFIDTLSKDTSCDTSLLISVRYLFILSFESN